MGPVTTTTTIERRRPDVAMQVWEWRLEQLQRAGFDAKGARLLATRSDVDLHRALRLAERGSPPETALRILL
jgi:hypothetical protein